MSLPLLSSGQDASQKYPANDGKLIHETNIQLAAIQNRILYETARGYSLNIEGNGDALVSPINDTINSENYLNYEADLVKAIQTLIAHRNLLSVKQSSTANQIVLETIKIDNEATAPDGSNYAKNTPLPFTFRNGLCFCFKAILTNDTENPTTINIEGLSGLSGAIALLNEDGSNPILEAGFYYEVIAFYDGTPSNNKFYLKNGTLAKRLNDLNKLDSLLSLNGGTMKGAINMGSNKITNLANGIADTDAVNYKQLNDGLNNKLPSNTQFIARITREGSAANGVEKWYNSQNELVKMVQWGIFTTGGQRVTIPFHQSFPNACTNVSMNVLIEDPQSNDAAIIAAIDKSWVRFSTRAAAGGYNRPTMWRAEGY